MPDDFDAHVANFSARPEFARAVSRAGRILAEAGYKLAFLACAKPTDGAKREDGAMPIEIACAWAHDLVRTAPQHADDARTLVGAVRAGVDSLLDGQLIGGSSN